MCADVDRRSHRACRAGVVGRNVRESLSRVDCRTAGTESIESAGIDLRVSVVTNFSATREELHAFLDAAGDRLGVISCSLHLEYVDEDEAPGRRDS